ncbi:MAG: hypothetical protein HOM01_09325 [Kordiimonadaceae bacterium]|jgi:thiamine-phosphate pyrophosphorylase|nr:hypothetical protein [Kordiimonadaceae bacterium]
MTGKLTEISLELNRQNGFGHLPSIIFMTDQQAQPYPENVIAKMPAGSMVILRDYDEENRYDLAVALKYICQAKKIKILIAADIDLALMIGADGIHLPEYKMELAQKIRNDHPSLFITAAAHNEDAVSRAQNFNLNAVLLSPIFATKSHPITFKYPDSVIGPDKLKEICAAHKLPIYALGGINLKTADKLKETGIAGIAVIRGLER